MTGEKVLLARAKKGEIAAFESIVTTYENRVFSLALRSTGSEADAADITQEVFLRLWKGIKDFRGDSSLSTWLYRVCANLCVDLARKRAAETGAVSLDDEENALTELADHAESGRPESALEKNEIARELQTCLAMLSEEHRRIVILRDVAGMSYADIASTLELEEGTVKSRLARARAALRKILIQRGNISLPSSSKEQKGGGKDA
ncbi:MAG: sigma-70 family RNA polymerase sigma factor [Butyricicoccus sp.]|nr:sigma-70 family RNA polymerase sigma factor [Butyricicoccus sp.]MBQ8585960.1 sigma-70 family RNA polymerase sigma factor [Butyricicoccus sp.]